MLKINQTEKKN